MIRRPPRSPLFPSTTLFRPAVWQLPRHEPAEVVCHNDFAPYNLMFEGEDLTGVIDLDLASPGPRIDRKSTRLNSSHANISYAVFCLKKKTPTMSHHSHSRTS